LNVGKNFIGDKGLKMVCDGILKNDLIESLNLCIFARCEKWKVDCKITNDGLDSISDLLTKSKTLTKLRLRKVKQSNQKRCNSNYWREKLI